MNYYPHHIGDYTRDTAHLSMIEDGAYRRLLDLCYSTERPLPLDRPALYRKVRAITKLERAAIDAVLAEFFDEGEDGWHQKRCDEEIARAREDGEDSAAKRENERERQRRHRERRKELFAALRAHGIVPKWDTPLDQLQATLDARTERGQNADGNAPVTRTETAIHKPIANSQEPVPSTQKPEDQTPAPSDFSLAVVATPPKRVNGHKPDLSPIVIELPLNDGTGFPVTENLTAELAELYPAVDVPQTLREMKGWCLATPSRRKTKAGAMRFITSWLAREQNKG